MQQPPDQIDAALLAARQTPHRLAPSFLQTEARQQFVDAPPERLAAQAVEGAVQAQVFLDGQIAVERRLLEDHAQAAANRLGRRHRVVTAHPQAAFRGLQQRGQQPHQGGLAATVGTQQPEATTGRDTE